MNPLRSEVFVSHSAHDVKSERLVQGQPLAMLQLLKAYETNAAPPNKPVWPPHGPGESVLPFDVSLPQGVTEAIVASGERGLSSEEIAATFHLTSKLLSQVLRTLTVQFKVCCAQLSED